MQSNTSYLVIINTIPLFYSIYMSCEVVVYKAKIEKFCELILVLCYNLCIQPIALGKSVYFFELVLQSRPVTNCQTIGDI